MSNSIEFQIDRRDLPHTPQDLAKVTTDDLVWSQFVMPTTIIVGGVTMVSGARLPLIKLAYYDLLTLKSLPGRKSDDIVFPPGGGLRLRMDGSDIVVAYPDAERTGRTSYSDLLQIWQTFSDRVRHFLTTEFPDLLHRPELRKWLNED